MTSIASSLTQPGFIRALQVERIKYRRTSVLRFALGAPLAYVLIFLCSVAYHAVYGGGRPLTWPSLERHVINSWGMMLFPCCTIVITALASQLMQSDRMWTRVLLQPLNRATVYIAHVFALSMLMIVSSTLFGLGLVLVGVAARIPGPISWSVALHSFLIGIAALPTVAAQLWLGARWRTLAGPLIFGSMAFFVALVVNDRTKIITYPLFPYYVNHPQHHDAVLLMTFLWTIGFLTAGTIDFVRRDFA